MAVTTYWYANAFIQAFSAAVDWTGETKLGIMLTTSTYTPNQDTHDFQDDITNEVATANGYTQLAATGTGKILTTTTVTSALNVVTFDTADPQWTSSGAGFTARRCVIVYTASGVLTTNPVILWSDFGQDETASGGGTFTYTVAATGWGTNTPADATGFPA